MFVTSDVLAYNYERLFGSALTFPSVADSFHLAFYPFLVGGMLLLIHEREAGSRSLGADRRADRDAWPSRRCCGSI